MDREKILQAINYNQQGKFDVDVKCGELSRYSNAANNEEYWYQCSGSPSRMNLNIRFTPHADQMLLSRLKLPVSYIHRCPAELADYNANYWLEKFKYRPLKMRMTSPEHCRAVFSNRFNSALDDHKVFPIILFALENQGNFEEALCKTSEFTQYQVWSPDLSANWHGVDSHAGIMVLNSEIGHCALQFRPLVHMANSHYSVYANKFGGKTWFRHTQDLNETKLTTAISDALTAAQQGIQEVFHTTQEMFEKPLDELKRFVDSAQMVSENVLDSLLAEYESVQIKSRFDIAQDILRAVAHLPAFRKHLITNEVSNYLFKHDAERIDSVLDEL